MPVVLGLTAPLGLRRTVSLVTPRPWQEEDREGDLDTSLAGWEGGAGLTGLGLKRKRSLSRQLSDFLQERRAEGEAREGREARVKWYQAPADNPVSSVHCPMVSNSSHQLAD